MNWKLFDTIHDKFNLAYIAVLSNILFFTFYNLLFKDKEQQKHDEIANKFAAERANQRTETLNSGIGWSRYDVLEKFKTTLYFRSFGRMQTTLGWRCAGCSKNLYKKEDAEVDHIKPVSKYPELATTLTNLQILCRSCNAHKHAYDGDDWKKTVHKRRRAKNKKLKGD